LYYTGSLDEYLVETDKKLAMKRAGVYYNLAKRGEDVTETGMPEKRRILAIYGLSCFRPNF